MAMLLSPCRTSIENPDANAIATESGTKARLSLVPHLLKHLRRTSTKEKIKLCWKSSRHHHRAFSLTKQASRRLSPCQKSLVWVEMSYSINTRQFNPSVQAELPSLHTLNTLSSDLSKWNNSHPTPCIEPIIRSARFSNNRPVFNNSKLSSLIRWTGNNLQ